MQLGIIVSALTHLFTLPWFYYSHFSIPFFIPNFVLVVFGLPLGKISASIHYRKPILSQSLLRSAETAVSKQNQIWGACGRQSQAGTFHVLFLSFGLSTLFLSFAIIVRVRSCSLSNSDLVVLVCSSPVQVLCPVLFPFEFFKDWCFCGVFQSQDFFLYVFYFNRAVSYLVKVPLFPVVFHVWIGIVMWFNVFLLCRNAFSFFQLCFAACTLNVIFFHLFVLPKTFI